MLKTDNDWQQDKSRPYTGNTTFRKKYHNKMWLYHKLCSWHTVSLWLMFMWKVLCIFLVKIIKNIFIIFLNILRKIGHKLCLFSLVTTLMYDGGIPVNDDVSWSQVCWEGRFMVVTKILRCVYNIVGWALYSCKLI